MGICWITRSSPRGGSTSSAKRPFTQNTLPISIPRRKPNPLTLLLLSNILGRINGSNGLIQDMRDQTTLLRDMYQKLWLGENLPYFLGNILARYDEELGRWEGASNRIGRSGRIYDQHALPPLIESAEPAAK